MQSNCILLASYLLYDGARGLNLFNIRVFAPPLTAQPFLYLASYPFLKKCTSAAPIHRHERNGADNGKPLIHSRLWQSRLTFAGSKE